MKLHPVSLADFRIFLLGLFHGFGFQLLRTPVQPDKQPPGYEERGRHQGVEEVRRTAEHPATDHEAHHDGGAHGGRLPTRGACVKPEQGKRDDAAAGSRDAEEPQEVEKNLRDECHVQSADREDMQGAGVKEGLGNLVVEPARNPPLGGQATTPSLARISLDDGEVIERGVDRIKGSPSRPMTADDTLPAASQGGMPGARSTVTVSVASARPYPGRITPGTLNRASKSRIVVARTGSLPLVARRSDERSRPSGGTMRAAMR